MKMILPLRFSLKMEKTFLPTVKRSWIIYRKVCWNSWKRARLGQIHPRVMKMKRARLG